MTRKYRKRKFLSSVFLLQATPQGRGHSGLRRYAIHYALHNPLKKTGTRYDSNAQPVKPSFPGRFAHPPYTRDIKLRCTELPLAAVTAKARDVKEGGKATPPPSPTSSQRAETRKHTQEYTSPQSRSRDPPSTNCSCNALA